MGDVIATADYMIVNEGSLIQLKRKIHQILKEELSE
jgi:dephospho-CoA kinase